MKPGKKLGGAPRTGKWTQQPDEKKRRKRAPLRANLLLLLALCVVLIGGVGAWAYTNYDELGQGLLAQRDEAQRRPDWVALRTLPRHVPEAFLAVVDSSSFRRRPVHARTDGPHLARDLVRQVHRLRGDLPGEARELAMTPILQQSLSRPELLELYLNRIYMGRMDRWNIYGVGHASREYFAKEPQQLTVSEAATLAGMLLPPRLLDPEAEPGKVGARRNEVLRTLRARGVIDNRTFVAAMAEPLGLQPGVEYAPMTRPVGWDAPPDTVRLPRDSAAVVAPAT